jgi:hypothetical protein
MCISVYMHQAIDHVHGHVSTNCYVLQRMAATARRSHNLATRCGTPTTSSTSPARTDSHLDSSTWLQLASPPTTSMIFHFDKAKCYFQLIFYVFN